MNVPTINLRRCQVLTRRAIAELRIKLRLGQQLDPSEVESLLDAVERANFTIELFNNGTGGELAGMVEEELAKAGYR